MGTEQIMGFASNTNSFLIEDRNQQNIDPKSLETMVLTAASNASHLHHHPGQLNRNVDPWGAHVDTRGPPNRVLGHSFRLPEPTAMAPGFQHHVINENGMMCNSRRNSTANAPSSEPIPLVTPPLKHRPVVSARDGLALMCDSGSNGAPLIPPATSPSSSYSLSSTTPAAPPRRGVPHVYHDYSRVAVSATNLSRKKTGGVTHAFPEKLHRMLDAVANDEVSHEDGEALVGWLPHGRAFRVQHPKLFASRVMPLYFRQTKLTSFQRQLNLYGFRRITQGPDSGAYYHELFLRGRPGLCQRMSRQKVKGTGHKQPSDASSEPNFYSMLPLEAEVNTTTTLSSTTSPAYPVSAPSLADVRGAATLLQGISASFGGTATSTFQDPPPHGFGTEPLHHKPQHLTEI